MIYPISLFSSMAAWYSITLPAHLITRKLDAASLSYMNSSSFIVSPAISDMINFPQNITLQVQPLLEAFSVDLVILSYQFTLDIGCYGITRKNAFHYVSDKFDD